MTRHRRNHNSRESLDLQKSMAEIAAASPPPSPAPQKRVIGELDVQHIPAPNDVMQMWVGPDPERNGQPTAYLIGGFVRHEALARELFLRHAFAEHPVSAEECIEASVDFVEALDEYKRQAIERVMAQREGAQAADEVITEADAKETDPPAQEGVSEGGIVLP